MIVCCDYQMISDHFWSEALEFYCHHIHQTRYLPSQWLIHFQPHYLLSLPASPFQWWPRSYGRKRTANWWGLVFLPEGAWGLGQAHSGVSCSWQQHQPLGLLFFIISIHRTVCTAFKSQNFFPCTLPQLQSKSTFLTEYPARQSHSITFPLSSCWLPAGKSSLYLISKFEGIFLVYFHTGLDCSISYTGACYATNLKTDFPQKSVKSSSQHQEGTWAQQYRHLMEAFPLLPWSS